jgi:phosphoribosylanthranilate isomerase
MIRVKICGLTNVEDARIAAEAGADFLGLIFYPPSPRCVRPEAAQRIVEATRPVAPNVHFVGLFVDEAMDIVQAIAAQCGLQWLQLHGGESPEAVTALMARGLKVIKAFRVRDRSSVADVRRYNATAYLLDTYVKGRPGGTGHTFDWALAEEAAAHGPTMLAGGLNPGNVAEAVRVANPWGVDTSSGVELQPGRKDAEKVRRFISAAKAAAGGV